MEVTAAVLGIIKSVSPVNSEQADHRKEDSHTHTGAALDMERIELLDVGPAVTALKEDKCEDGGRWLENDRIPQLDGKLVLNVSGIGITRGVVRRQFVRSK